MPLALAFRPKGDRFVQDRLDGTLLKRIYEGKPNTVMGGWNHVFSGDELWDVLA